MAFRALGAPASSPAAQAAHSPSPSSASSRSPAAGGVSALTSAPTARPPGLLPAGGRGRGGASAGSRDGEDAEPAPLLPTTKCPNDRRQERPNIIKLVLHR
ncbi:hypothetical protein BS78_05G094000 [Paspalum vaginatum]|nr:hypothetical protein BS78_05G094000 [Paspalum vaginatum]